MAATPRKTAAKKTATPEEIEAKNVKLREEIAAATERVQSLAEAENAEGVAELKAETEGMINDLPTRERTALRATLAAAAKAQKPEPKAEVEVKPKAAEVELQSDYHNYPGVAELVAKTAERIKEVASTKFAGGRELANMTFDAWIRITTKDGVPDVNGVTQAAKGVTIDAFDMVVKNLPEEGTDAVADGIREEINSIKKSMQNAREDVRVEYIRALEHSPEEAARFAAITEGKEGSVVDVVAEHFGTTLLTRSEKAKLARDTKKAIESKTKALEAIRVDSASKVEKGEMTAEEAADAVAEAEKAVEEAASTLPAPKVTTPEEDLTDAITKMSKLTDALKAEAVAGIDEKKQKALKAKAEAIQAKVAILLANWK
jgi:hypothetical protein